MRTVEEAARKARADRVELPADNLFSKAEKSLSSLISSSLTEYGKARDAWTEQMFFLTYSSPFLQALVGVNEETAARERHIEREGPRDAALQQRRSALEQRFDKGGLLEATLRAIAYIKPGEGGVDERGFAALRAIHDAQPVGWPRTLAELQDALGEQSLLVRMDEARALSALPKLLPKDAGGAGQGTRGDPSHCFGSGRLVGRAPEAACEDRDVSSPHAVERLVRPRSTKAGAKAPTKSEGQ